MSDAVTTRTEVLVLGGGPAGKANLRIAEQLTSCQQLEAGPTQLMRPVMYVALTGPNSNIAALHTWANRNPSTNLSPLIVPLGGTGEPPTPDCFTP